VRQDDANSIHDDDKGHGQSRWPSAASELPLFLTPKELAALLNKSVRTLQRDRVTGGSLPFTKHGRSPVSARPGARDAHKSEPRVTALMTAKYPKEKAAGMRPRDGRRSQIQLGASILFRVAFRNDFAAAGNSHKGTDDRFDQRTYAQRC
jgi:hypothetical protein